MKFEDFTRINHWQTHLIGHSIDEVERYLGNATDYGSEKHKKYLALFNDIEVGFNDDELAFYVQIDLMENQIPEGTKLFNIKNWPIYGGMSLEECKKILNQCGCPYKQNQPELNPGIIEIHTKSNVVFSFIRIGEMFMGKGLVNVRTNV